MEKKIMRLADVNSINDHTLKTLQDDLGIKELNDLNQWTPWLIHQMFPDLSKEELYALGSAAKQDQRVDTILGSININAADEFHNQEIRSHLPNWDHRYDSQGINGSCTAFAATSLLEFYASKVGWGKLRFSRAFTYILGNLWEGQNLPWWSIGGIFGGNDWGIYPDTAGRILTQYGSCLASELPYDENHDYFDKNQNPVQLKQHPSFKYDQNRHLQLASRYRANMNIKNLYSYMLHDWVTVNIDNYLRAGFPSVYAFKTSPNVDINTGVVARKDGDTGTGHSVLIIGKLLNYTPQGQETGNWYIFRNSHAGFGVNSPLGSNYTGCGLMHEHDVYWRQIQSFFPSW